MLGLAATIATLLLAFQATLGLCESSLGSPEPARVLDLFPRGEGCEGFQTHVDTDLSGCRGVGSGGNLIAREHGKPLARLALESDRFDRALDGAMKSDTEISDILDANLPVEEPNSARVLRECDGVEAVPSLEARVARGLSSPQAPEETIERALESVEDILSDLGGKSAEFLELGSCISKLGRLSVEIDGDLPCLPGISTLFKRVVVEVACGVDKRSQDGFLTLGRTETVLEGPSETCYVGFSHRRSFSSEDGVGQGPKVAQTTSGPALFVRYVPRHVKSFF